MVTLVGRSIFRGVRHFPVPGRLRPSVLKVLGDLLYMRAHNMRNSYQILRGAQCEEKFYTVDNEC